MRTILEEAKLILSSSPDGLLFDDLYNLVGKNLNLDEEQYQENKLDLFIDLNNSNDVHCLDQKWFLSVFLNGRDVDDLKKSKAPDIHDVNSFIDVYVPALEKEVEFSYMNRKRYLLTDGLRVDQNQGVFSYAFDSTDQINIPADSSIHIYLDEDHFLGRMVSCAEDVVIFESYVNFGETIKKIEISTDTKQLMVALIDKLNNMRFIKGSIPERLVCDGKNQVSTKNIIKGQENAIEHASNEPITFIWGPPGTGKTHTLATIALKFIREGKRVLMVSYSNVSVDGAIDRIYRLSKGSYQNGEIIRYGYPRDENLINNSRLNSYSYVLSKNQKLYKEYKDLNGQRHLVDKKVQKEKILINV